MSRESVFLLAQIINSAGSDPSDICDAVWSAGYRKPELNSDDLVTLTIETISACVGLDVPFDHWPKTPAALFRAELNELVEELQWAPNNSPAVTANKLIDAGYRRAEIGKAL